MCVCVCVVCVCGMCVCGVCMCVCVVCVCVLSCVCVWYVCVVCVCVVWCGVCVCVCVCVYVWCGVCVCVDEWKKGRMEGRWEEGDREHFFGSGLSLWNRLSHVFKQLPMSSKYLKANRPKTEIQHDQTPICSPHKLPSTTHQAEQRQESPVTRSSFLQLHHHTQNPTDPNP